MRRPRVHLPTQRSTPEAGRPSTTWPEVALDNSARRPRAATGAGPNSSGVMSRERSREGVEARREFVSRRDHAWVGGRYVAAAVCSTSWNTADGGLARFRPWGLEKQVRTVRPRSIHSSLQLRTATDDSQVQGRRGTLRHGACNRQHECLFPRFCDIAGR